MGSLAICIPSLENCLFRCFVIFKLGCFYFYCSVLSFFICFRYKCFFKYMICKHFLFTSLIMSFELQKVGYALVMAPPYVGPQTILSLHWTVLASLSKFRWPQTHGFISRLSILFHTDIQVIYAFFFLFLVQLSWLEPPVQCWIDSKSRYTCSWLYGKASAISSLSIRLAMGFFIDALYRIFKNFIFLKHFCHEKPLGFIKCFLYIYWDNHWSFGFYSIDMVNYINWFSHDKSTLHLR